MPKALEARLRFGLALALGCACALGCASEPPNPDHASGEALFVKEFEPANGLGPLYNARSCVACHSHPTTGGVGVDGLSVVFRVGALKNDVFDALEGRGGPVARNHSVSELGHSCGLSSGVPALASVVSTRNTPPLYGLGAVASIAEEVIESAAASGRARGVGGRVNWVMEDGERVLGRLGWKAQASSLPRFVGEALRTELGITNPVFPSDLVHSDEASGCAGFSSHVEAETEVVERLTDFLVSLPPLAPASSEARGAEIFDGIGCAACHTPSLPGAGGPVPLYSDLLIHDMGPALADGFVQGDAQSRDWRTTPLWGLRFRSRYLHDGRASTLLEAIAAHDGEAAEVTVAFTTLAKADQTQVLAFLSSL